MSISSEEVHNLDSAGKKAVSVTYVDTQGNEFEQPADLIIMTAFVLHNVHLLLVSGIGTPYDPATGKGTLGKNYAYQIVSSVDVFYDDKLLNPFIGAGALGMVVDEYNGDNFDHTNLDFIGGRLLACLEHQRSADRNSPDAGGDAKMGIEMEESGRGELLQITVAGDPWIGYESPRKFP